VEIEGQTWTTVNPFDGSFAAASAVKQWVDFDTDEFPAEEIESGQRLVFPLSPAPTKVKFGTIEISATAPFSDQTVSFNSVLNAGTSYTLVVDVKRCVWARSNIYWDGNKLTFVPAGMDTSKEGYQGVHFKFGSLIGISPALTSGAGNNGQNFSTGTILYKPTAIATGSYSSYADIPYWSNLFANGIDNTKTGQFVGDICRYINSNYRLPEAGEFGTTDASWSNSEGWISDNGFSNIDFGASYADGTADFLSSANGAVRKMASIVSQTMGITLPASGYRNGSTNEVSLSGVGSSGYYWTSTINGSAYGYSMYFSYSSYNLFCYWPGSRTNCFAVRCVQN
jgi:hypothetical protein